MKVIYNGKTYEVNDKLVLHTGGKFVKSDIIILPDGVEEDDDISM